MPEGPELHLSSLNINKICHDLIFSGKIARNPIHKCAEIDWDEPSYKISAESRGKELKLHLQAVDDSNGICEDLSRDEKPSILVDNKDKKRSRSRSRSISRSRFSRSRSTSILFTFGMSGKFEWTSVNEMLKHSHLTFYAKTDPGIDSKAMALSFVDYRRFGKWYQDTDWSPGRGPCVIQEYEGFVNNVVTNLDHKAFSRPICEVMLDQQFFSGIGNYLRAEILFRVKVAPFERAQSVLQATEEKDKTNKNTTKPSKKNTGRKKKHAKEEPPPMDINCEDATSHLMNHTNTNIKIEPSVDEKLNCIENEVKNIKKEQNEINCSNMKLMWGKLSPKGQEILQLCHSVPLEVVQMGSTKYTLSDMYKKTDDGSQCFDDWLQCYYQDGMKNLADHNKRTIWFSGPAGPLAPREQKSRGKKASKKSSKDVESNSEPKAPTKSINKSEKKEPGKERLTRKRLKEMENAKENGKTGKKSKEEATPRSNSKRKRKAVAVTTTTTVTVATKKSNPVKRRKKDSVELQSQDKNNKIT